MESSEDEVDDGDIAGEIVGSEGGSQVVNYEDPNIQLGRRFKDSADLKFCLAQHSVKANFNYKFVKNDRKRVVVSYTGESCT